MLNQFLLFFCLLFTLTSSFADALPVKQSQSFFSFADLHFDPFLSCKKQPCPLIQKLQAAPESQWSGILSRNDNSESTYGKDSNYALLKSALAAAHKKAQTTKAQFVLVLGDFMAHNYDKKYRQYTNDPTQAGYVNFIKKTMAFLTTLFNQAFPETDVYIVVGNNDTYGNDYSVEPHGDFFKDLSLNQASLIKDKNNRHQFQQDFPRGGYYAVNAPQQPGLRLLFLNSVLFSNKAKGPRLQQAASEQLAWLHKELTQAQQKKQQVLIAMHIPTGVDVYTTLFIPFSIVEFWKPVYSQRFLDEVKRASSVVLGVFQGHIHADAFQILSTADHHALPFNGIPSITPIFGNNPAFKIYTYSLPVIRLVNFSTYYLPLNDNQQWQKEYDFDVAYQLNHGGEMIKGMLQLGPTGELAKHYKTYYAVNRNTQPITKDNKWLPYYWCAIHGLTAKDYRDCLSVNAALKLSCRLKP